MRSEIDIVKLTIFHPCRREWRCCDLQQGHHRRPMFCASLFVAYAFMLLSYTVQSIEKDDVTIEPSNKLIPLYLKCVSYSGHSLRLRQVSAFPRQEGDILTCIQRRELEKMKEAQTKNCGSWSRTQTTTRRVASRDLINVAVRARSRSFPWM